ncbi:MAG TPA: class II SORL domain-containing protein [Anaerolineae bacterium]|nr:class II SORL domain-containing protein [Anaerolineae bacterium]HQH37727.1 class II SORL domain-containing protein [Anaerolineae bacterium]
MKLGDNIQTADWKKEKHAPVIEAPDVVTAGEPFTVKLSIGKEIPHPNTTAHHINWIELYFKPEGDKFIYQVGHFDFVAHGAAVQGADSGPVWTHPVTECSVTVKGAGTLIATALCNIHGLWENSHELKVE